ncbi:MAG: hypothetical protein RL477_1159 [Pseudomonadota bacterium]
MGKPASLGRLMGVTAAVALALSLPFSAARAETEAEFFKGKTVRFVIGGGAGGGYDIYMRMLAPHFAKRLGVTAVPVNRPGAGMMLAMNQVYQSKPDGLTVFIAPGEAATIGALMGQEGLRFDMLKYPILARINTAPRALIVNPKSPYKTIGDVINSKKPVWIGANGKIDGTADTTAIFCHALKAPCRIAIGYPSSKEFSLAAVRGEVDGTVLVDDSASQFSAGGQLRPVVFTGRETSKLMPGVPTVFDQVKPDAEATWWIDFRDNLRKVGRLLMVPPGMSAERLAFMRQVTRDILTDLAIVAEFEGKAKPLQYAPPEEMEAIIRDTLGGKISEARVKEIRYVINEKFYGEGSYRGKKDKKKKQE